MTAHVLGERLYRDIHAMCEGFEENAGGPGIIECNRYALRVRCLSYGGNILYLHRYRAGTLAPYKARIRLQSRDNALAFQGLIIFNLDIEFPKYVICEGAARTVDAFGNQNMIAGA